MLAETHLASVERRDKWECLHVTSHIKLYGSKGDRFEAIKSDMASRFGYEPSNPEVLGYLMASYNPDGTSRGPDQPLTAP